MRLHLLLLSNMKRLSLLFIGILASYNATHAQIHRTEATDSANVSQTYNLNPIVVTGYYHLRRRFDAHDAPDINGTQLNGQFPASERTGQ